METLFSITPGNSTNVDALPVTTGDFDDGFIEAGSTRVDSAGKHSATTVFSMVFAVRNTRRRQVDGGTEGREERNDA